MSKYYKANSFLVKSFYLFILLFQSQIVFIKSSVTLIAQHLQKTLKLKYLKKIVFIFAHIKKLEIPSSVKNLEDDWCRNLYDLREIEVSPKSSHFILYNKSFLLGKSSKSGDRFDVLHFARSGIKEAVIPLQVTRIKKWSFDNHDQAENSQMFDQLRTHIH